MERTISTGSSLSRTLWELILLTLTAALLLSAVGVCFAENKVFCVTGFFCGAFLGILMAAHMAYDLSRGINREPEYMKRLVSRGAAVRYLIAAAAMGMFVYYDWGNFPACVLGLMCLKAAAYIQPAFHKCAGRIFEMTENRKRRT